MKKIELEIQLLSDTLIGTGETSGAIIDTDVVFDEMGFPYIPSKRIKGCLRDSLMEVKDYLSDISFVNMTFINQVFGEQGMENNADTYFDSFFIKNYSNEKKWISYFKNKYPSLISPERVKEFFTNIRKQTSIDTVTFTAKETSLRTSRVINKGTAFLGEIIINSNVEDTINLLQIAAANLRSIGTKRNRGFGNVSCRIVGYDISDFLKKALFNAEEK